MNQVNQQLRHHWDNCLCSECEQHRLGSYWNDSQVHFIRHGLSVANAWEKTLTPDWIILSETWHHQAAKVSETLALQTPDKIWYSRYIRTQQTANPTLRKFPDIPHEVFPYIHEKTYLDAEMCANTNHAERREIESNIELAEQIIAMVHLRKHLENLLQELTKHLTTWKICDHED